MTIAHTLLGTGNENVILCHGWFGDGEATFGPMLPYLDKTAFTYAVVDYRGYGSSKNMIGSYTIEEISRDVIELADSLQWERFHVVGHSMGGKVLQRIAVDAGQRVKSGIAITPVPASKLDFDSDTSALFEGAIFDDNQRMGIVNYSVGNRLKASWATDMIATLSATSTREAFGAYLSSWSKGDFSDQARGLDVPLKVIVGEFDPTITPAFVEATFGSLYPKVEFETLQNAGHYPAHEVPVYLATTIENFLTIHR